MNEGRDVWSGGTQAERSAIISKSLRTTLTNVHRPQELFPKVVPPSETEVVEKETAAMWEEVKKRRDERGRL